MEHTLKYILGPKIRLCGRCKSIKINKVKFFGSFKILEVGLLFMQVEGSILDMEYLHALFPIRLVQLIDDLLNFSRYQNGVQTLQRTPQDLAGLIQDALQRCADEAQEREVSLTCEIHDTLPHVSVDAEQLSRLLDNLLSNALRYSNPGGTVQLQARRNGEQVIVSVQDAGEGIPFGQQGRIFEPFVQVGRRKGGVGLGLALAREIVQLHGGQLNVDSSPGEGALFYFSLPV